MAPSIINISTALATIAILTAPAVGQSTTSSSFDWDSAISAADTATTSFDLYTTNGSLGPGVLDTSSRFGLYTSATPIVGPIGNGTVANGTTAGSNGTMTMTTGGGGGATDTSTGSAGGGNGASGGASGSEGSSASAPAATGNGAASAGGVWMEGAGLLVGIGAVMAVL